MASNRDLQAEIETLSAELGVSVPEGLQSMKNPRLVEALEALQARKAAQPVPDASGDGPAPRGLTMPFDAASPSPPPPPAAAPVLDQPVLNLERGALGTVAPQVAHQPSPEAVLHGVLSYPARYFVVAGQQVPTKRGLMGAFQQVKPHDFSSPDDFRELLSRGLIAEKA
jgi:hypothetical protein